MPRRSPIRRFEDSRRVPGRYGASAFPRARRGAGTGLRALAELRPPGRCERIRAPRPGARRRRGRRGLRGVSPQCVHDPILSSSGAPENPGRFSTSVRSLGVKSLPGQPAGEAARRPLEPRNPTTTQEGLPRHGLQSVLAAFDTGLGGGRRPSGYGRQLAQVREKRHLR